MNVRGVLEHEEGLVEATQVHQKLGHDQCGPQTNAALAGQLTCPDDGLEVVKCFVSGPGQHGPDDEVGVATGDVVGEAVALG
jgi:hypothetical protein